MFQVATTFLCKRTSTLAQAEDIIRFVCTKLEDMNTELSLKLVERLKIRYFKRRNTQMVSMSKFFENPSCFSPSTDDEFKMPTKATITRATKALHGRLYPEEVTADETEASTGTQQAAPANLAGELSEFLRSSHGTNRPETDTFTKEFNLHVSGGERTRTLQQTYEALLVVPPTSVEAERVFSASGLYLTKIRCRMSDSTLDMLMFLKFYFRRVPK